MSDVKRGILIDREVLDAITAQGLRHWRAEIEETLEGKLHPSDRAAAKLRLAALDVIAEWAGDE